MNLSCILPNASRCNRGAGTRRFGSVLVVACTALGIGLAHGHIIPPENLHPVAEAYRRATFVLNLNPVVWEQIRSDVEQIADYWQTLDGDAATSLRAATEQTIERATVDAEQDGGIEPLTRREASTRVFDLLTRAAGEIVIHHLAAAGKTLDNRRACLDQIRLAQGVWRAYEVTVRAADPEGFRDIGRSWLGLSSALGSEGLLTHGAVASDRAAFDRHAETIRSYTLTNFGPEFAASEGRKLAPLPTRSPTFDAEADADLRLPPGHNINKQIPRPRQILNIAARGVDEGETALIALGDMAFDSAYVFGEPMRSLGMSCNNCHNKSITNPNLFIPGLSSRNGTFDVTNSYFAPHANNGVFDPLDVPDLRGIRFTAPYGRNGRIASLREFVRNVIMHEFNGPEPDPVVLDGLIAYMNEFDFLPNPAIKGDGTLTAGAPEAAQRGEKIFNRPFAKMDNKSCATCHVPSSHFLDRKSHDIGTVRGVEPHSRDRAMDTPTLLGIKYTPPYFHDGSQATIRGVVEWFNMTFGLGLDRREIDDLTAYVETVGDGADAYEDTSYYLDAEMEEFSFFLSAFEFLDQKQKPQLMAMTFQTIALEIRNHKWELRDWSAMPVMDRLAQIMDEAYTAVQGGDLDKVKSDVLRYRQIYAKNVNVLK